MLLEEVPGIPDMEHFAEHQAGHTSLAVPIANVAIPLVEASQLGATAVEEASIQVAEPEGEEVMFVGSPETSAAPKTESMEVELLGGIDDRTQPISWESRVAHVELGELMGVPMGPQSLRELS